LEEWQPHVVIAQGEGREDLARDAFNMGYPAIIRLVTADCIKALEKASTRDAEITKILRSPRVLLLSVSEFIANRAKESLGIEAPVVPVLIRFNDYIATRRDPQWVTFINPIKMKGLELALEIAAILPHRKFLFVEAWPLAAKERAKLDVSLKRLPNVSLRSRSLQMRDVYQVTSLLLVPSQCEDAFGRVIVEAAANGIPAVASRIGGIPEAIAEGGILLSPTDQPETWAREIERLLSDEELYASLAKRASLNAGRIELNPEFVGRRYLQVAEEHARRCRL
jgi:glycosyltransferase involved in cell wall biosynthesis